MNVRKLKVFALIYSAFVGPQALLHLILGSSLACVAIWSLCLAVAFAFVYHGGLYNTTVWISLLLIARYVGMASFLKIGLAQPLDSYLYTPIESYLMTLCMIVELYLAYRLVACMPVRKVIFKSEYSLHLLLIMSYVFVVFGTIAFIITNLRSKEDVELGGFRLFTDSIYTMGIISRTAYVLRKSEGRSSMDPILAGMLVLGIGFAVLINSKGPAITCMLAYLLTVIGLRRAVPWRILVVATICIWLLIAIVTPVIHVLRTQDANNKTMGERLDDIVDFVNHGSLSTAREEVGIYGEQTWEITDYFGPLGMFHLTAQRIAFVQNADPIKRGIDSNGYLGPSFLLGGFSMIVPRVLNPDKDMDSPADIICWHAGVQDRRSVNRQAIGIVAGSYAIAGWTGVAIIPFFLYAIYLLLQRIWSDTSSANIFAIFFVTDNYNKFVELEPTSLIGVVFREIELEMIVFLFLIVLSRLLLGILCTRRTHSVGSLRRVGP